MTTVDVKMKDMEMKVSIKSDLIFASWEIERLADCERPL